MFGVKSTFNEELYTTKLEKGPQMQELEKQALRIAREIEGEDARDLHLAEVSVAWMLFLFLFFFSPSELLAFCLILWIPWTMYIYISISQQERGIHLHGNFDIDEETRFSSVYRGKGVDDSGYDGSEDILSDSRNSETFGGTFASVIKKSSDLTGGKGNGGARISSNSFFMVFTQSVI